MSLASCAALPSHPPQDDRRLDERSAAIESLVAIQRAGAEIILTYWAPEVARWLAE